MPTARGSVKCDDSKLVGTFDVYGNSHHFTVEIKPSRQSFECTDAVLTYVSTDQLAGPCNWLGTLGKTNIQMSHGADVSISGPLDTRRISSVLIRGAGAWNTGAAPSVCQPDPVNQQQENGCDDLDNNI